MNMTKTKIKSTDAGSVATTGAATAPLAPRSAHIVRRTAETEIDLTLCLDADAGALSAKSQINTGVGFLDHMLTLFAHHGGFSLTLTCRGDTFVDDHHTTEDIGICLGQAIAQALGDKAGINRYGHLLLPMDEALILCAIDISGRGALYYDLQIPTEKVGSFDTQLAEEFFRALAGQAGLTLHLRQLAGSNSHHIVEGAFKAFARALRQAVLRDPALAGVVPSTKGVL